MAAQDDLFELIKSLNPSEKRYFKVNATKGGDAKSNYIQLFDAIDSLAEYDEDLIKKRHKEKNFIKYLSAEKNQLREQLLKQMRSYHTGRSVDNRIHELLQDEAFFRDKGLRELREKTIQKAKELATEFERYHLLQVILEREISFVEEFEEKVLTEPVLKLITELKQLFLMQESKLELWTRNKEIFAAYRTGADAKDPTVRNRMDVLMAEIERYHSRLGNSFLLNIQYHRAYSNYHFFVGDPQKAHQHNEKEYELFQQFPQFKLENPNNYKICLANVISRSHSAGKKERFQEALAELKSLPISSFDEEGEVFQNVYFSEHLFYINSGQFEQAADLVPEIEKGLTTYAAKINKARLLSFQFNIMVMYFLMHRFKEAANWADKVLEDKSEIKQGIHVVTRILLPIIHFELGHHDLVENLTRSAYRYLLAKKRLHSFERLMVGYLKEMSLSPDSEEFTTKLKALDKDLTAIFNDPKETKTHGMEEVNLWVKSHLTSKKMEALLASDSV